MWSRSTHRFTRRRRGFDDELLGTMRRGTYLINTARGKICDRDAIVRALGSGQLAGYAGDVWYPQPPPKDHPWRTMPYLIVDGGKLAGTGAHSHSAGDATSGSEDPSQLMRHAANVPATRTTSRAAA